jgi:hypothetical protein
MTPQENETWAEVAWKPGHGPDDTDAADEQIREWALACQAEFSKDPGPFHVEVWAKRRRFRWWPPWPRRSFRLPL